MKTKKLMLGMLLSLFILSCSKDENTTPASPDNAKIDVTIDAISDDISQIVSDQYDAQAIIGGRFADEQATTLPPCATVSVSVVGTTWTRTITFAAGCTLQNGNVVSGTIIISGSTNFTQPSQTISYSFVDFHHNNKLIQGNRTVVRTLQITPALATLHPVATMNLDMTVTFPNGNVYHRVGTRVREMIAGFATPAIWLDNIFSVTGTWTTSFPDGTQSATITTPLIVKMSCPHIVSGVIQIVRNNNTGILNYGDGTCDNIATLTINGVTTTIILGN